jgi:hypothetical protein
VCFCLFWLALAPHSLRVGHTALNNPLPHLFTIAYARLTCLFVRPPEMADRFVRILVVPACFFDARYPNSHFRLRCLSRTIVMQPRLEREFSTRCGATRSLNDRIWHTLGDDVLQIVDHFDASWSLVIQPAPHRCTEERRTHEGGRSVPPAGSEAPAAA